MIRLNNRTAVITGAARGIGKATAGLFLEAGAKVSIWDVDAAAAEETVQTFREAGHDIRFQQLDTTDFQSVAKAAEELINDWGRIDILINNAGITRDASLKKMSAAQWQMVIDVNLTGVFNCTKAVAPFMTEKGFGRILNAASVVGLYGNFGQGNYVATKSGVIGLTKVWARELGRKGVTVNAVSPGFIQTEMIETVPEGVINNLKQQTPLGRLGSVEEIAHAYLFLASDQASFITGTNLSVDGGLVL
ncbi:MAG: beta-ketoacyl-ACP reductase [Bacteroidota bacterium]